MTAKSCSGSLVLFGSSERKVIQQTEIITTTLIKNVYLIATKKTYNARNNMQVQREVEERTGIRTCILADWGGP